MSEEASLDAEFEYDRHAGGHSWFRLKGDARLWRGVELFTEDDFSEPLVVTLARWREALGNLPPEGVETAVLDYERGSYDDGSGHLRAHYMLRETDAEYEARLVQGAAEEKRRAKREAKAAAERERMEREFLARLKAKYET